MTVERPWRIGLRVVALGYLALLLLVPVGLVFWRTFEDGLTPVWESITTPAAISAFWLTLTVTAIAVPLNTIFGVLCALSLARGRFRGKAILNAIIDLPFAISPVVVGLALILVYGRGGWLGDLPYPGHLRGARDRAGDDLHLRAVRGARGHAGAARGRRRAGAGGVDARRLALAGVLADHAAVDPVGHRLRRVLSVARCIGEFGAVSVVSGKIAGETETLTLLVEQRFQNFDLAGAYAASALLAFIALGTLLAMTLRQPTEG